MINIKKINQTNFFKLDHIEACSGGGGRIDYEVLSRTHRFWASDNNDALERQIIQKGASYFYPLEITGAHIGQARIAFGDRPRKKQ